MADRHKRTYPTQSVLQWIYTDEKDKVRWLRAASAAKATEIDGRTAEGVLADQLRDELRDEAPELLTSGYFISSFNDMLTWALGGDPRRMVNWHQVARHLLEDLEE